MQDQHEQSEQPPQETPEEEADDEVTTLSANPDKSSRSLKEQQYALHPQPKGCCCFNTRCEFFLFLLITLLVFAAGYLIYDNRMQEGEISQILTILQKAQHQKHLATTASQPTTTPTHQSQAQPGASASPATVVDVGPKVIPRKVWYFNHQDLIQSKQWTQLAFQRIKTLAQDQGFEMSLINQASWPTFIPASRHQKLESIVKRQSEVKIQGMSNAKLDRIVRQLTVLEVLREHGGIFIEEDVILTEKLQWVLDSTPNQLVNAWQLVYSAGAPQVVGFYNPEQSSQQQKEPRTGAKEETEQYIVRFPSISSVFLAATPSNPFIIDLLQEYYAVVLNNSAFLGQLKRIHMEGAVGGDGQGLMAAACQLVLRKKQLQLQMDEIAVEFYRIAAINANFGPAKLRFYLGDTQADKIFNHLSLIPHKELQYQFGIIRYCALLAPMERLYGLVDQAIQSKTIVANSFLHMFLLGKQHVVLTFPEQALGKKKWEALPAKLWVYLQGAAYSTPFFTQLWMRHLEKAANDAKFQLKILNQQNLEQYLSKETVAGINQAITTNKLTIYDYTKKQLISLAVLHEHGGVWVEPFVFLPEGLAWLRDISEKPFIWNRFGELPRVVAAFHPHFGSPFHWTYKEKGIREAWHLAYQHSLIAAQPHAELIGDWFSQLKDNLQMDYASVMRKFEGCSIKDHKWIAEQNHQLLSQDSIKCALGTRQLQLQVKGLHQSAPEYYGLWGLNGFAGLLKMREYTNFVAGRTMENPLIWRYSFQQMQNIVGNVSFCAKIYDPTANRIEQLFGENLGNPLREFHSQSFVMKLVGDSRDQVIRRDGRLYLEREWRAQQQSRSKMLQEDRANTLLANMPKILWIFESIEIDRREVFTNLMLTKVDSYAQMSGFQVRFVTDQNYKAWLNPASPSAKKLNNFLIRLNERVERGDGNLKDHSQRIRGQAILLTLLYQNGGVFLTRKIAAHQDFSWIHKVETLDFINRAGKSQPQVFGFFSPGYSSPQVTLNGQAHVESPSLENFFLASGKKAEYVRDFLDEYMRVLEESKKVKERLRQLKYSFSWLRGDDPFYECFFLASQFALHQKNEQLLTKNTTLNAIQYYGLYCLNTHYYPYRLHKYFSSFRSPAESVIRALTGTHLSQLQAQVGPLKYFSILPPRTHEMAQYIEQATKGTAGSVILEGSFVHKFLMPTMPAGANGVAKIDMVYDTVPPKGKWEALPKAVYVYVPEGIQRASFGYQLMVAAIRKGVSSAGFQLKMVDNNNLQQYIDKVIIKKVNKLIVGDKEQYRSLIFRLAILSKHGGVALLPDTMLTEDFGWLVNIGGMDRRMIFNRHGDSPKVLLSVDTLRTPAVNWTYNPQGQTKTGHSLGWTDTLIAAQKDNELLKEWFEQLTTYFQLNPQELSQVFEECGIRKMQWSAVDPSRLGSDALVCILNRKKKELQSQRQNVDVCGEYRLWGVGESFGMVKMQDGLNLQQSNADLNPFLWRRERKEVERTIGGIRPMVRLSERQVLQVGQVAREKRLGEWGKEKSLLMSQVSQVVKSELSEVKGQLVIAL